MTSKWDVNTAVRSSNLPAPSRLIMLTLADVADAKTAVIPEERGPSLREIAEWTGLGKASVVRHLTILEESGWIVRDRPDINDARREHARTGYRLYIGHVSEGDMPKGDNPEGMSQAETSQTGQTESGMSQSETGHVSERDKGMSQSETVPYTDEVTNDKTTSTSGNETKPKRRPSKQKSPPDRPEVEALCQHLADRMVANGCKRPRINDEWRVETARLIDLDGRTPDQIRRCIDWATSNIFWRKNILSMPKLRAKYDQLRMAAEEERERAMRANGRASPKPSNLVEHNGLMLGERNQEAVARHERIKRLQAAKNAGQASIEGAPG